MEYQSYNTGDQVWTSQRYGQRASVKVITHDAYIWVEGDTQALRKLTGLEYYLHWITVKVIQGVYWVMNA